jgi:Acetyltransferase (GNAT) domain
VRLLLPVIRRAIPGSDAFDLVSPYGYPSPIARFEDVALLRGAFSAIVQTLRERGFVSMFVRLHPILELPAGALTDLGTLVEHGQTVSIDLRQNEAEQWRGIRARYRTFLNRSERLGHRVFMDDTGEHLDRFITLYLDTMRRQNAAAEYFFSRDYLSGLWQRLRGHVHLGVVEIEGSVVCAGLFGESNGIVQYHLSGTEEQALQLSPLPFCTWVAELAAPRIRFCTSSPVSPTGRHFFKTWHVVLDEQRYAKISVGALRSTGSFPAYRGSKGVTSVGSARGASCGPRKRCRRLHTSGKGASPPGRSW